MIRLLLPLAALLLVSGCATFTDVELAEIRSRGVSPPVVGKLDRGGPLSPAEVIELTRRRVPETWIIRHLDDHGVDSLVTKDDLAKLRKASVHPAVVDAVLRASNDFADAYRYPDVTYSAYSYDPYYGYYDPWYYPVGFGATFSVPLHHGPHHHRHFRRR